MTRAPQAGMGVPTNDLSSERGQFLGIPKRGGLGSRDLSNE